MAVQRFLVPPPGVVPPFTPPPAVTPAGEPINDPEHSDTVYFGGKNPNARLTHEPLPFMDDYLDELRNGDPPRSPDYVRMVRVGLLHFANFARQEGIRHPNEIKRELVLRYQVRLAELTSPATGRPYRLQYRQQLMRYLRGWIRWLIDVEHLDHDPWKRIRIGQTKKEPKPLSPDQLLELFDTHRRAAFSGMSPFAWHRRGVILALLLNWGLRINELQSLNVAQVRDRRLDWVRVRNKGGSTKTLPLNAAVKDEIHRWLSHRAGHAVPGEDALLIDQTGGRLSIYRIREIVTDLGDKAGMKIHPHQFRDMFVTLMMNRDVPIERVMAISGHQDPAMLRAYAEIGSREVSEAHAKVMDPIMLALLTGRPPKQEEAS